MSESLKWENEDEFNAGTFDETEILGTGNEAKIVLASDKVNVFNMSDPTKYTYNTAELEFVGGISLPKQVSPLKLTFYADYNDIINANYGGDVGPVIGTPTGTPVITNQKLDLSGGTVKYVDYPGANNAVLLTQLGCIRFRYTPKYTGFPPSRYTLIAIGNTSNNNNRISIYQTTDGVVHTDIYDASGNIVVALTTVPISAVPDVEVVAELNWDIITGESRLFANGSIISQDLTSTGLRSSVGISTIRVGSNLAGGTDPIDFLIDDVELYYEVQHTGPHSIPPLPLPYKFVLTTTLVNNEYILFDSGLLSFVHVLNLQPTGTDIKYQISDDNGLTWKYWSGSEWIQITASQTDDWYYDNQSNDIDDVNDNIEEFSEEGIFRWKAFFRSTENNRVELESITVDRDGPYEDSGIYTSDVRSIEAYLTQANLTFTVSENTTIQFYYKINNGEWAEFVNNENFSLLFSTIQWKAELTSEGANTPIISSVKLLYTILEYTYRGWTVRKDKIADIIFNDPLKINEISSNDIEEAVDSLILELDQISSTFANTVDKTDPNLHRIIAYFVGCNKTANGSLKQAIGNITSESLEGMSISYGQTMAKSGVKATIPINFCDKAIDTLNRWLNSQKKLIRTRQMVISNSRERLFAGTWNKERQNYYGKNYPRSKRL